MTTPTNFPARAETVGERNARHSDFQWTGFRLAVQHPATVYTARVNQTFSTLDEVAELTYDGGSGTLANVKEGMTILIGSTAGAHDKGVTMVRKTPTSSKFYIRPTSKIQFADNDHITVVDSFSIWGKPIYNKGGIVQMDTDIEFGAVDRGGVIPRIGPLAAVIEQTAGTITFVPPNPSLSAAYDGATISSYLFSAPGALTTSNMSSPTNASWTYPLTADGEYRYSCKITDSLGRETTSYRRVFVNPSNIPFKLNSVSGDFDSGNWSASVTAYANIDDIYDRAMATLYRRDYQGGVQVSSGKLAGFENICMTGWIDGESVTQNEQMGWVDFTIYGPAYWMSKVAIDPLELNNTIGEATKWTEIQNMTVDKILAHVLYWMTTAPLVMDCFFTGDENKLKTFSVPGGYIWDNLNAIAKDRIFAVPRCNSLGQLFIEIDPQIADDTARGDYPVVLDITPNDFEGDFEGERYTSDKSAQLQLSALQDADGVTDIYIHSRAPGNVVEQYGSQTTYQDYTVASPAECRRIAGRLLAVENNEFGALTFVFPGILNLFDIAPCMVATITTDGIRNPRGTELVDKRLHPRQVQYSEEKGVPKTTVTFEVEVDGVDGVDYFPPTAEDENLDLGLDDFGDFNTDFPGIDDFFPETVPPEITTPCNRNIGNNFTLTWSPRVLTGSTSQLIARALFPCMVRATGGLAGNTSIKIQYNAFGDADSHKTCYATLGGTRVLTGSWVGDTITFSPLSDTQIDGFEIVLDAGAGSIIDRFEIGKFVERGAMGSPTTQCVKDKWYCIEPYTGYWTATFPAGVVGKSFYNVFLTPGNSFHDKGVGRDGDGNFHLYLWGDYVETGSDRSEAFDPGTQAFVVSGNYGRIYFKARTFYGAGSQATLSASNSDTLGRVYHDMYWALYEAKAIGRQLVIGVSTLYNVCAIE